ncbi:hypothetical protein ACSNOI_03085 [Actinomadura kijaniata]|uniref:hypothetical protein n=1 Tax=Actinomadura kijaniata TaxID=46161 RepID=UPI003F1AB214
MTPPQLDRPILRRLSAGGADPLLVTDFQSMSMAPRLSEMLGESVPGRPVFQIDPVGVLSGTRLYAPLPELAATCARRFLDSGAARGHVVVVGHCSASALSLRVADLLAAELPVTAVLLQPAWADDELVTEKFAEYLAKFGPTTRACPDLDADPGRVVAEIEQLFRDEMAALAASRNLGGATGAFTDLLVWYRAWLSFLLACRNDTSLDQAVGRAAVVVLSDSPSTVTVPGLARDAFQIRELPSPQPAGPVTPELAGLVAEHVGALRPSPRRRSA